MRLKPGNAALKVTLKGVHAVKTTLASGEKVTYFYAWRGGPRIVDAATKKPLTDPDSPAFRQAYDALKRPAPAPDRKTLQTLVGYYRGATEFTTLADSTRKDYGRVLKLIEDRFGTMPIALLSDPRARGKFKEWRDSMAEKPRTADFSWSVLARLLAVAKDRGLIAVNPCEGGGRLYQSERADCVWTEEHLRGLFEVCSGDVYDVVMLALWTGQRQGDLLRLTWSAYDGQHIRLRQGKTGARVVIPVGPTLRATLDRIPRTTSTQILTSSLGTPWTSDGFRTSFGRSCAAAGIDGLTFHDLRGTAVTRLSIAGCTPQQIATITGHSLATVSQILDAHYLSRDVALAEEAIRLLEKNRSGTEPVKRPVKRSNRSGAGSG